MENINYKDAKIIIIDDDVQVLESVKDALEVRDMQIKTFSNPIEGLEYLKNNTVDVLILDYYMPEMNGSEVVEKLREYNNNTIVILQTGYADQIPPLEMIDKINIQGYVDKEDGIEKLILSIKSAIKTSKLLKEIEVLTYKKALIGKMISSLVNESTDQLFNISLANGFIEEATDEYKKQNKTIEESLEKIRNLYEALNFEYKKEMSILDLKRTIEELMKAEILLNLVNFTIEIENESLLIDNPKEIIFLLIKTINLLFNINAKNINVKVNKGEKIFIRISSDVNLDNLDVEEIKLFINKNDNVIIENCSIIFEIL